jgi:hypothetical protein
MCCLQPACFTRRLIKPVLCTDLSDRQLPPPAAASSSGLPALHWRHLTDATLPQVMHLLRDTGTVLLAVGATLSIMALHCRWTHDTMRVAYTDKSPLCAISAVAILAGHPKDFSKPCFVGAIACRCLCHVSAWRPCCQAYLHCGSSCSSSTSTRPTRHQLITAARALWTLTLIVLTEAQLLRVLSFRLQQYSSTYALLQAPQLLAILASPTWPSFQQQVLACHAQQGGAAAAVSMGHACSRPGRQAGSACGPSGRGCQSAAGQHAGRSSTAGAHAAAAGSSSAAPSSKPCCSTASTGGHSQGCRAVISQQQGPGGASSVQQQGQKRWMMLAR